MTKVLLIEDDDETAGEIAAELADRGFDVEWSSDGLDGLAKARDLRPDAMIVDRLLPGMDGLTVIESLRKDQVRTPVLVLSALGAVDDRVRGLRMGGDDYLTKPFAVVELIARIEALLRRPPETRETTLRVGQLELDLIERTAKRGERRIDLLPREFRLHRFAAGAPAHQEFRRTRSRELARKPCRDGQWQNAAQRGRPSSSQTRTRA